eukprot:TRINITY_DN26855_c0_g1_i1.p1 TRINITY_DN26855_c0_g1~~TRINITY_DN26855_c0_g1_i1.p1  ORF type:complete len:176 (-),score=33.89 TRINITY_DN26855_c0_g1_i1:627-1154(-)
MSADTAGRCIFISATYLVDDLGRVPPEVIQNAVFFFGSKRSWIFPSTQDEVKESRAQPTNYLAFPEHFKLLIQQKERDGLCFFLKPSCDYGLVSKFIEAIQDPVTGQCYQPLRLDPAWWRNDYKMTDSLTRVRPERVIINFQTGDHDYSSTMELLYQSNRTMLPVLQWNKVIEHC